MGMAWLENRLQGWLERLRLGPAGTQAEPFSWAALGEKQAGEQRILHVGCGTAYQPHLPGEFKTPAWREVRLDADPDACPDLLASMTDMGPVPDGAVDAVFSSHGVEHLYWHDVPLAFSEFFRVLADDGILVVTCPDLQAAAAMIAEDKLFEPAYESPAGTITPFDIVYSYRPFVEKNPQWMSHHCGYTLTSLMAVLREAGFVGMFGQRRASAFDLWVLATKQARTEEELQTLARRFLPATE